MNKTNVPMPNRERFRDTCFGKRPGDVFIMDWFHRSLVETVGEWIQQGAPEDIRQPDKYYQYFQFDHLRMLYEVLSEHNRLLTQGSLASHLVIPPIVPIFEKKVLEEDERHRVEITEAGYTVRVFEGISPQNADVP